MKLALVFLSIPLSLTLAVPSISAATTIPTQCSRYYEEQSTTIVERFQKYYSTRSFDFFGLTLSEFIERETYEIRNRQQKSLDQLRLKGTAAKIPSELSALEIHIKTLGKKLRDITSLLESPRYLGWLKSDAARKQTMETKTEDFAICRTRMDACTLDLKAALLEGNETIKQLQTIIHELKTKHSELVDLSNYLKLNIETYNSTALESLLILERTIAILSTDLQTSEATLALNSRLLTTATLTLMDVPELYQQIKEAMAKGASENLLKNVENDAKKGQDTMIAATKEAAENKYQQISKLLESPIDAKAKLSAVYHSVKDFNGELKPQQSLEILKRLPKNVTWGEQDSTSKYNLAVYVTGNTKWTGWFSYETIIAYELAVKTVPAGDSSAMKFIGLFSEIMNKESHEKKPEYQSAVTALISNTSQKLISH